MSQEHLAMYKYTYAASYHASTLSRTLTNHFCTCAHMCTHRSRLDVKVFHRKDAGIFGSLHVANEVGRHDLVVKLEEKM